MNGSISALLSLRRPGRARAFVALTGAAFLACWLLFPPAKAACGCVFLLGLIGAACIDLDHMIIPDLFTIGLAFAGLALSAIAPGLHEPGPFSIFNCLRSEAASVLGLAIGSSLVLWFGLMAEFVLGKEVLGFGDVKFVGAIGAFCGWQGAVFSLFGGAAVGVIALIGGEIHRRVSGQHSVQLFRMEPSPGERGKLGWGAHFPFGPMLAVAAAAYFLALHPAADRFLSCYAVFFGAK